MTQNCPTRVQPTANPAILRLSIIMGAPAPPAITKAVGMSLRLIILALQIAWAATQHRPAIMMDNVQTVTAPQIGLPTTSPMMG
jgi:hypothetical protein